MLDEFGDVALWVGRAHLGSDDALVSSSQRSRIPVEIEGVGGHADRDEGAADCEEVGRRPVGGGRAGRHEYEVGEFAVADLAQRRGSVTCGWVDAMGRAEGPRDLDFRRIGVHRDDRLGTGDPRALHHVESNTTAADNDDPVLRGDGGRPQDRPGAGHDPAGQQARRSSGEVDADDL